MIDQFGNVKKEFGSLVGGIGEEGLKVRDEGRSGFDFLPNRLTARPPLSKDQDPIDGLRLIFCIEKSNGNLMPLLLTIT